MRISRMVYGFWILLLALGLLLASVPEAAEKPSSATLPKIMGWTSYGVGTASYIMSAIFAEAVEDVTGTKVKVTPSGTDVGRLLPLIKKEAYVTFITGSSGYFATAGIDAFSAANWGPQRLRVLWKGHDSENTFVVKGTSSIKTGADLKGKRVAYIPGNVSVNKINEAYLAFHNLKWEDVVKVNLPGFGEALKAIADGSIDTCMGGTAAAGVWEMQASPDGVRFLPMPSADKAGWERLQSVCPFMYPTTAKGGLAAKDPKLRVEVAGYPAMMPITYADMDDALAYAVTKSIHVKYDWFKDRYSLLDQWTLENCEKGLLNLTLPMHPGSVKYLKEIGAWKPQHEKWQSQRLRLEADRIKAWNNALAEAKAKGIRIDPRDEKWTQLWEHHLAGGK